MRIGALWFTIVGMWLLATVARAQSGANPVKENAIERLVETISETTENELDYTALVEDLYYYYDNPINLNQATKDELAKLNLLSEPQILALFDYIKRNGPLLSIYEMQLIPGWNVETLYVLNPFLQVAPIEEKQKTRLSSIIKYGKHEIVSRVVDLLEEQDGYRRNKVDPNDGYLGSSYQLFARYRFTYKDKVSFGWAGRKDRGEEFFRGSQPQGFDFNSAHLFIRNVGIFRKIAIGDYQLQFGQGLTMWTGLAFGKTAYVMNVKRYPVGVRQYTATNAFNFNRGVAAEVRLGRFDVTGFFSHKKIDGTVSEGDSLTGEELEVASLLESGFHRTNAEISKKGTIGETIYGGHVTFRGGKFNIGATAVQTIYSAAVTPTDQAYNLYRFRGTQLFNAGIDYDVLLGKFYAYGEFSVSENGGFAMTHGIQAAVHPNFSLAMLYRQFGAKYQNNNSNAISDRLADNNETGLYVGFETTPIKYFKLQGYFDVFSYPWMRFGISAPARGHEALGQLSYIPSRKVEAYVRVRHQFRPLDGREDNEYTDQLIHQGRTNYRFNFTYEVNRQLKLRSRFEYATNRRPDQSLGEGFMVYQDVIYKPTKIPVDFSARIALFQVNDFDARIFTYENDVLYSFSVPGFNDKGMRWYLNMKIEPARDLDIWFRIAQTYFENRNTIGSGLDMINGNVRTEFKIQMKYNFRFANFKRKK